MPASAVRLQHRRDVSSTRFTTTAAVAVRCSRGEVGRHRRRARPRPGIGRHAAAEVQIARPNSRRYLPSGVARPIARTSRMPGSVASLRVAAGPHRRSARPTAADHDRDRRPCEDADPRDACRWQHGRGPISRYAHHSRNGMDAVTANLTGLPFPASQGPGRRTTDGGRVEIWEYLRSCGWRKWLLVLLPVIGVAVGLVVAVGDRHQVPAASPPWCRRRARTPASRPAPSTSSSRTTGVSRRPTRSCALPVEDHGRPGRQHPRRDLHRAGSPRVGSSRSPTRPPRRAKAPVVADAVARAALAAIYRPGVDVATGQGRGRTAALRRRGQARSTTTPPRSVSRSPRTSSRCSRASSSSSRSRSPRPAPTETSPRSRGSSPRSTCSAAEIVGLRNESRNYERLDDEAKTVLASLGVGPSRPPGGEDPRRARASGRAPWPPPVPSKVSPTPARTSGRSSARRRSGCLPRSAPGLLMELLWPTAGGVAARTAAVGRSSRFPPTPIRRRRSDAVRSLETPRRGSALPDLRQPARS